MTTPDPVTEIRAHYTLPQIPPATWESNVADRGQIAMAAWLAAARDQGFDVTVLEIEPPHKLVYGVVEVNGQRYTVEQHGRGGDVEAKRA
ncbi:hypothetical protein AB0L62_33200 [Nocardia asteroides]|uniref:hypothetical protein n=1 Tax=Nocardia asteroides TaxID=1824 RepID=UPI0034150A3B